MLRSSRAPALILLASALVTACGGSGSSGPKPAPISPAEAARFLTQTTFGPVPEAVADLQQRGYAGWIEHQIALPVSRQLPYLQALPQPVSQVDRLDAFFQNAIGRPDQLRQRMAFALSEIFVVSDQAALFDQPLGLADYYDLLAAQAFGNFRELMERVTLHPAMGVYLSMLANQKADPDRNIRPDENYARELLQLFTIGLVELRADGSVRLDNDAIPLPTFDQAVIEGFAQVNTGWTFGGSPSFFEPSFDYLRPMEPFEDFHDTRAKRLLGGVTLPPGGSARQDLGAGLDLIFAHPNVGPFIGRQLIQRLVTSNPTPAYVGRVAGVFNDNGNGVRGDLAAVIRAILLDAEARATPTGDTAGKLKEPLLRLTALFRAYDAKAPNDRYLIDFAAPLVGQAPLQAPSVFNFFRPGYAPPGEIATRELVSPEMQITTEFTAATFANVLGSYAVSRNNYADDLGPEVVRIDLSTDEPFADPPARLVSRIADRLTGGVVSPVLRAEAEAVAAQYPAGQGPFRIIEVLNLFLTSPEYAVQR